MKKALKTFLIFCLVAATTAQGSSTTTGPATTTDAAPTTQGPISSTTPSPLVTETTTTQGTSTGPVTTTNAAPTTQGPISSTTPSPIVTEAPTTQGPISSTTPSPIVTESTTTQGSSSTASANTTSAAAGTTDTGSTTQDGTTSTAPPTTTTTPATTTQGPCASSPCIGGSTCENRFEGSFACICRPGLFYDENDGCIRRKVFPGNFKLNEDFKKEMADTTSKEFKDKAQEIEDDLRESLKEVDGYIRSIVLKLSNGSIVAEVQNIFEPSSTATSEKIEESIEVSFPDSFESVTLCGAGACDSRTTKCNEQPGGGAVTCTCLDGYIKSDFSTDSCIACPSGEKAVDGKCEKCPFGFAGFNCDDSNLLIVVVVSAVLGSLLIIFMVSLIVVSCRNQKGSSSPEVDFSLSYGNKDLHKPTGVPRIPRANPESNWKSNNLEMTNSDSNQSLVTRDRPESKGRYHEYEEAPSYRTQVPPAYSGYSAARGMDNGGVQNPYFRQDDDRMHRY
ncbi:mucin-13b isoform X1 [Danio rerio]|uniref:Mucin-13b isoform X1 n=1 Tax=Danio rerio TaxID=7955 RepID=A0A8M9Q8L3_DANRE|nr:mucin 13b, cell surface associated isoform X1 [Danio rerio]|eukprot:XP_021335848.1 mucin 13b, cell surface associated isoform X1 [Danio rerio]